MADPCNALPGALRVLPAPCSPKRRQSNLEKLAVKTRKVTWVFLLKDERSTPLRAAFAVVAYCLIGALIFTNVQGLSSIDAVYFMVVTLSTVGYGDISPATDGLKWFTVFWIFVAVIFVFPQVVTVISRITAKWTKYGRYLLERLNPPALIDIDGDGTPDFKLPDRAWWYYSKNMVPSIAMMMTIQIIAATVFVAIENWTFSDAFYHCLVTATTVGYGDMSIASDSGKIWACVQILVSVALLGEIISTLDTLRDDFRQRGRRMEQLHNKMNPNLAENLIATCEKLQDPRAQMGDGVTQMQFMVSMLVESGVFDASELDGIRNIFAKANVDDEGMLSKEDLKHVISEMQVNLSEGATLAGFDAPPPVADARVHPAPPELEPAPEPEPPPPVLEAEPEPEVMVESFKKPDIDFHGAAKVIQKAVRLFKSSKLRERLINASQELLSLSEDIIEAVQKEADAQLQLTAVELSVKSKMIKLLFPIEFSGTNFENSERVEKICTEVAQAISVCNQRLVAKGLMPFGLNVEGHTSQNAKSEEQSKKTSYQRATLVSTMIAQKLANVEGPTYNQLVADVQKEGRGTMPSGGIVKSTGLGCTRKLAGFDDGGNYKENRRVEIHLVEGDGEGDQSSFRCRPMT